MLKISQTDSSNRYSSCSKDSITQNGYSDQQIRVQHMRQCARICYEDLNIQKRS